MSNFRNYLSTMKSVDEYQKFKKLTELQRRQEFNNIKNVILVIIPVVLCIFVLIGMAIIGVAVMNPQIILMWVFVGVGVFITYSGFLGVMNFLPLINAIRDAQYCTDLQEDFFSTKYWTDGEPPDLIKKLASQILVELDEQENRENQQCREDASDIELISVGEVIGSIGGSEIHSFVEVQDKNSGRVYTLKYAGFSETDPIGTFRKIAPPLTVGFIYHNVIYLE